MIAEESSDGTTIEGQVCHEATRAVVHEDTLLLILAAATLDHVEDNVLETSCLCHLPMYTSASTRWQTSKVDDEIPNLTIEVILIRVPICTFWQVRIGVEDSDTLEVGQNFDRGQAGGVSNHLSVVVLNEWSRDHVGTGREVDHCRSGCRGVTPLATSRA